LTPRILARRLRCFVSRARLAVLRDRWADGWIFDFPTIRYKSVDLVVEKNYRKSVFVVTRSFWLRIIWLPTQKTIILGRWVIHLQYREPGLDEIVRERDGDGTPKI
jgi:hypothetical protein